MEYFVGFNPALEKYIYLTSIYLNTVYLLAFPM